MAAQLALDVNGATVIISVDVEQPDRPPAAPAGSAPARLNWKDWSPEAAHARLMVALGRESAHCPREQWPGLAAILRTLADRLDEEIAEGPWNSRPTTPPAPLDALGG